MKRAFSLGSGPDRRMVLLEVDGARMTVVQKKADGTSKKSEKVLSSEAAALVACDKMMMELIDRGYVEKKVVTKPAAPAAKVARTQPEPGGLDLHALADAEDSAEAAEPLLPRMAAPVAATAAEPAPKKKKKGKKKKKKAGGDDLDKRVLYGAGAAGVGLLGIIGFLLYAAFLQPATIVGHWEGSMIEFETGGPMSHTTYKLVLDDANRASMTLQDKFTSTGTYALKGDRLKLVLKEAKDEGGSEPQASTEEYKIILGRSTLDLHDPATGKKVVQLIRFREKPVVGGGEKPPQAPTDAGGEADKDADAKLVTVEYGPKDGAFRLKHPPGWEADTGSRPDNTYSWCSFTKGSAKIQVYADVQGSLMSGSDTAGQHEEGSEFAPVHRAHELYVRTASEEFSDYKESKPVLFKGADMGEGRIASFTASGGGLFGSKLKGYHVTLLSNNRRISILAHCPDSDFEKLKPTFLALCRSIGR